MKTLMMLGGEHQVPQLDPLCAASFPSPHNSLDPLPARISAIHGYFPPYFLPCLGQRWVLFK